MSMTTSNDGTYQDLESGTAPFTRIVQQTSLSGTGFANASYLRLGGYIDSDEQSLLPPDTQVWHSTVDVTTYNSSQDYDNASLLSAEGKGSVTTAQAGRYGISGSDNINEDNTQTQNLESAKAVTDKDPRTPLKSGILMYSDKDLQINTAGAAYMEFQQGHSTYIKDGDSNYMTFNGQMKMQGNLGLTIQAGVPAVESEADMQAMANARARANGTAQYNTATRRVWTRGGYVTETYNTTQKDVPIDYKGNPNTVALPADLYIIASNNISQKAYGPLDEVTYGDSYKNVHGTSTDIFYGTSYKEVHGDATEIFKGTKHSWVMDADATGKLAASVSMFLGVSTTINLSVAVTLSATLKADLILGVDFKLVVGESSKMVAGQDTSLIGSGFKFVTTNDIKVVTLIDAKSVLVDMKRAEFKYEIKGGADLTKDAVNVDYKNIYAASKQLESKLEGLSSSIYEMMNIS